MGVQYLKIFTVSLATISEKTKTKIKEKTNDKDLHDDWWETVPAPAKQKHFINIQNPYKLVSKKLSFDYDLKGSLPCPKFVVSPWIQSSIEPDFNIKSLL